ncbi:MAG: S41 family peptidase [Candidatus Zixiibacteriota bacterium]
MISLYRVIARGLAGLAVAAMVTTSVDGQIMSQGGENRTVTSADRKAIVDTVGALLERMYVLPEKAKAASKLLHARLKGGKYDSLTTINDFSLQLTKDLRGETHDGHLWVEPADKPPVGGEDTLNPAERRRKRFEFGKSANFGFENVEILPGNIGLLTLNGFYEADIAGATGVSAMNFLAHSRALIIDLRKNGGGDPSMIQLITSYFFETPVHLNSFYSRLTDSISQFWTQAQVEGPRMAQTPIYVLTSRNSFSAAEEFVYNLQNLHRAHLVGETTGGGAHPNDLIHFPNLRINVSVAWGKAINPITGTNWEGVGVVPDVPVSADKALSVARMMILDSLAKAEPDSLNRLQLTWWRSAIQYDTLQYSISADKLADYAGQYGPRKIWVENGSLWYQRDSNPKAKLIPLEADLFQHSSSEYFRVKFVRDASGKVIELVGIYAQGRQDSNPRQG